MKLVIYKNIFEFKEIYRLNSYDPNCVCKKCVYGRWNKYYYSCSRYKHARVPSNFRTITGNHEEIELCISWKGDIIF